MNILAGLCRDGVVYPPIFARVFDGRIMTFLRCLRRQVVATGGHWDEIICPGAVTTKRQPVGAAGISRSWLLQVVLNPVDNLHRSWMIWMIALKTPIFCQLLAQIWALEIMSILIAVKHAVRLPCHLVVFFLHKNGAWVSDWRKHFNRTALFLDFH